MIRALFSFATVFGIPAFSIIALAAIAFALTTGAAQATGPGVEAETAELLPVVTLSNADCANESFDGDCSVNANVQRTVYNFKGSDPTTQFAAIAENFLSDPAYGLYNLIVDKPIGELTDDDCTGSNAKLIGDIPIDENGKLAEPTTIGFVSDVFDSDVVFVCRLTEVEGPPWLYAPRLILGGTLARGAKGGGKNRNK